jgi:transcriptional regulator with XRE-family HTH domain
MSTKSLNERILFGLKLKQLRQKKNLSFAELAAETGMSISYLNEIEKGKKFPKEEKLDKLAAALELSLIHI